MATEKQIAYAEKVRPATLALMIEARAFVLGSLGECDDADLPASKEAIASAADRAVEIVKTAEAGDLLDIHGAPTAWADSREEAFVPFILALAGADLEAAGYEFEAVQMAKVAQRFL